jgi:Fe(3+) dicitrate transport protein
MKLGGNFWCVLCLFAIAVSSVWAEPMVETKPGGSTVDSPKNVVSSETSVTESRMTEVELRNLVAMPPAGFLSDLEDVRIYAGEKNLYIDPAADPIVVDNNFRYLLSRKTGAMLLEEEIQGVHFNVGFRGLAPNNAISMQVFQDGFPLNVDVFGSRFVPFVPDINQTTQVQFANSGFGVLAGPQVGGLTNFISYPIAGDQPYRIRNTTTAGSFEYFSDLFEASGTLGSFGYAVFGRYAQGDGFGVQSAFSNTNAGLRVVQQFGEKDKLALSYQFYFFDSDTISGVALNTAGVTNVLTYYYQEATAHLVNLLYEHDFSDSARLVSRIWYHDIDGFRDFRQLVVPTLGEVDEKIHYIGTDTRYVQEYDLGPLPNNILTAGFTVQGSLNDLKSEPSRAGEARLDLDRHDFNWAFYIDNKFQLCDGWSITAGGRVERAELAGDGIRGDGGANNNAFVDRHFDDYEPLFSISSELDLFAPISLKQRPAVLYANFGNGYRAPTYNETVNQGFRNRVDPDLESAVLYQVEGGVRGTPVPWFIYDLSGFYLDYDNQFATFNGLISNAGRTHHQGAEVYAELNVFGLIDCFNGTPSPTEARIGPRSPETESGLARWGRLSLFGAVSYLDTEIDASPFLGAVGTDVPYAPEWIPKAGLSYNYFERIKASVIFKYVSDYLGNLNNDNILIRNNTTAVIPAYTVVDFSVEFTFFKDRLTLFFNLNNVFDEKYFAGLQGGNAAGNQITAPGRNAYGGFKLTF